MTDQRIPDKLRDLYLNHPLVHSWLTTYQNETLTLEETLTYLVLALAASEQFYREQTINLLCNLPTQLNIHGIAAVRDCVGIPVIYTDPPEPK